jgi:hypothetical protein
MTTDSSPETREIPPLTPEIIRSMLRAFPAGEASPLDMLVHHANEFGCLQDMRPYLDAGYFDRPPATEEARNLPFGIVHRHARRMVNAFFVPSDPATHALLTPPTDDDIWLFAEIVARAQKQSTGKLAIHAIENLAYIVAAKPLDALISRLSSDAIKKEPKLGLFNMLIGGFDTRQEDASADTVDCLLRHGLLGPQDLPRVLSSAIHIGLPSLEARLLARYQPQIPLLLRDAVDTRIRARLDASDAFGLDSTRLERCLDNGLVVDRHTIAGYLLSMSRRDESPPDPAAFNGQVISAMLDCCIDDLDMPLDPTEIRARFGKDVYQYSPYMDRSLQGKPWPVNLLLLACYLHHEPGIDALLGRQVSPAGFPADGATPEKLLTAGFRRQGLPFPQNNARLSAKLHAYTARSQLRKAASRGSGVSLS